MNKINEYILEQLYKDISLADLIKQTGLSSSELAFRLNSLKNLGFNIDRKYYSNSDLLTISKTEKEKYANIQVKQRLRFLALSDTHIGYIKENLNLLDAAFEYAVKNGIHYIFHCGDAIEGSLFNTKRSKNPNIKTSLDEAYYFLKCFPSDESIHTMMILGNHDIRGLRKEGFNLASFIETNRSDITMLGTEFGSIKTGEDFILLHHPFHRKENKFDKEAYAYCDDNKIKPKLILRGHLHRLDSDFDIKGNRTLLVPALCDNINQCGVWDVNIEFVKIGTKTEMYEIYATSLFFQNKLVKDAPVYTKVIHKK